MRMPAMQGQIERRLLVNYAVDADMASRLLPAPFRPQLVHGAAVAGICLIRLSGLRPAGMPRWASLRSENAAHRIAVEWDGPGGVRSGVYIPRRDSDSGLTIALGGRLFPGQHHRARFRVAESAARLRVAFRAADGSAEAAVDVRLAAELTGSALFPNLKAASRFFERGSVGYSPARDCCRLDGIELRTSAWQAEAGVVTGCSSSFFADPALFPPGSARVDCALVMRRIPVTWASLPSLLTEDVILRP